ncbi:MAG: PQQ-like beta-propeller repeat protein [Spirochaetales bacterium]|nr:PQQ-like beta-propeller repeat protein [Spirochaetales bacterium]
MTGKGLVICFLLFILSLWPGYSMNSDWPGWRGPDRNSIIRGEEWDPLRLENEPDIVWKINAGNGYSSFAITEKYLYTMGNTKNKETVWCFDVKTGKEVWNHTYPCTPGQYPGPRCTPLLDGDKVYTLGEKGNLFCFNAENGKVIWQKNVVSDFKAQAPSWNFASSPVIEGNTLYLNVCKYGIALKKENGQKIWVSPSDKCGYSSPLLCVINKVNCVLMFGMKAIYGVNRDNGKLLWQHEWITSYDVNAADPVVSGDTVFISSGYNTGCTLLQIKNNKPSAVWKNKVISSHFSSFIFKDGYIYGNDGAAGSYGTFKCVELATGKEIWGKRLGFGSLVATEDHLIMLTERGKLHIAQLSSKGYEEIARATVLSNTCWTPPVLCRGMIFCRNHKGDIVCIDVRKQNK